jgi:hypothetical protein
VLLPWKGKICVVYGHGLKDLIVNGCAEKNTDTQLVLHLTQFTIRRNAMGLA